MMSIAFLLRLYAGWTCISLMLLMLLSSTLNAETLPSPKELQQQLGAPTVIQVIEPHMSRPGKPVMINYVGYPIQQVMRFLHLNQAAMYSASNWIEFACTDGYVSRIPADKFKQHQAYLVVARQDQQAFQVDNLDQQQQRISLGPYYLVWDNTHSLALQKLGAYHWPYQVQSIASGAYVGNLKQAKLANDYCLTCHQLNGQGGKVLPINLAQIGQRYSQQAFIELVLHPNKSKPSSTMPPLNPLLADAQREKIAKSLYIYFNQIPAK